VFYIRSHVVVVPPSQSVSAFVLRVPGQEGVLSSFAYPASYAFADSYVLSSYPLVFPARFKDGFV